MALRRLVTLPRRAAARGDVDAIVELGILARDGLADRRGKTLGAREARAASRYFRRAAELGSVQAMDCLAMALTEPAARRGRRRSSAQPAVREAIRWYRKAIRRGGDAYSLAATYQDRATTTPPSAGYVAPRSWAAPPRSACCETTRTRTPRRVPGAGVEPARF